MFYWVIEDCNLSIAKIDYWMIIDYRKDLWLLSGIVQNDLGRFSEKKRAAKQDFSLMPRNASGRSKKLRKIRYRGTRVSDLMRGKWDKFSLEMLIH